MFFNKKYSLWELYVQWVQAQLCHYLLLFLVIRNILYIKLLFFLNLIIKS